jgi:stress response protein YsnF
MQRQTVSAMFDNYTAATQAVRRLKEAGFQDSEISIVGKNDSPGPQATSTTTDADEASSAGAGATVGALAGGGAGLLTGLGIIAIPGLGPVVAAGWLAATLLGATAGGVTGGLIGALTGAGVSEDEAHEYAEGVRRGGTLVTVQTARVDEATAILDDEGTVDIKERSDAWRNEGWAGRLDERGTAALGTQNTAPTRPGQDTASTSGSVPVVEENLQVGKQVQRQRVRVHPVVTETPVEKNVTLRDERAEVVRRDVDRPATESDYVRQREGLEATEKHEMPIIEKRARVVGEVSLDKNVTERQEKVRDTVRKTDVEIEDNRDQQGRRDTKKGA